MVHRKLYDLKFKKSHWKDAIKIFCSKMVFEVILNEIKEKSKLPKLERRMSNCPLWRWHVLDLEKHRAKIPFKLIYKLSNFAEYKINPQNTIAFPGPNDNLSEKDTKKTA